MNYFRAYLGARDVEYRKNIQKLKFALLGLSMTAEAEPTVATLKRAKVSMCDDDTIRSHYLANLRGETRDLLKLGILTRSKVSGVWAYKWAGLTTPIRADGKLDFANEAKRLYPLVKMQFDKLLAAAGDEWVDEYYFLGRASLPYIDDLQMRRHYANQIKHFLREAEQAGYVCDDLSSSQQHAGLAISKLLRRKYRKKEPASDEA